MAVNLSLSATSVRLWVFCIGLVLFAALAIGLGALFDQPKKVARIGYLSPAWPSADQAAFEQKLRSLGYRIAESVNVEYRFSEGNDDRLDSLAVQLLDSHVDVIVALSPEGARAAQRATRTVPIVFVSISDPVGMGLVYSTSLQSVIF